MGRHWVNTVSRDHVLKAVAGGFTQAGHGRDSGLRRLGVGDRIAFYSPRTELRAGDPLQEFTALGTVTGEAPYQVEVSPDFTPWRVDVRFEDVHPAPVRPLLESLGFVRDLRHWGMAFRRGLFTVSEEDFAVIERALTG